jgi:hypothetical protein
MPRVSKGTRVNGHHKPTELPSTYRPGFLSAMDGRLEITKTLKHRFDTVASDLGGVAGLSTIQRSLLERFVWLEAAVSRIEQDMASAEGTAAATNVMARWIQACNSLMGFAKTLGLNRVRRDPWALIDTNADGAGGTDK